MKNDIGTATTSNFSESTLSIDDIYEAMAKMPDPVLTHYACSPRILEKIKEEYEGEYTELDANHIMIKGVMIRALLLIPDEYMINLDELERQTRLQFGVPYQYLKGE